MIYSVPETPHFFFLNFSGNLYKSSLAEMTGHLLSQPRVWFSGLPYSSACLIWSTGLSFVVLILSNLPIVTVNSGVSLPHRTSVTRNVLIFLLLNSSVPQSMSQTASLYGFMALNVTCWVFSPTFMPKYGILPQAPHSWLSTSHFLLAPSNITCPELNWSPAFAV